MGSFRSQPELTKHSIEKKGLGLSYAATHMCGNHIWIKVGASTWRTRTSTFRRCLIKKIRSLACSMATEVVISGYRCIGVDICGTSLHLRTWKKQQLPQERVWKSTQGNFPQDGWAFADRSRQKIDHLHTKRNARKRQRTQVRRVVTRRLHCQRCPHHSRLDLLCQRRRFKSHSLHRGKNPFWTK